MKSLRNITEKIQKRPKATIILILLSFITINSIYYSLANTSQDNQASFINCVICLFCIIVAYSLNTFLNGFLFATKTLPIMSLILITTQLICSSNHTGYQIILITTSIIIIYILLYKLYHHLRLTHYSIKKYTKPKHIYKVSAVIPNYNYATYLNKRVQSILSQKYPIYEIIFLDDASTDDSENIIKKEMKRIRKERPEIITKFIPNKKNSGNVFKQWEKCFSESSGDFVWICEADDSCSKYFLNSVMRPFEDKKVVLSYAESSTINEDDKKELPSLRPWIDIFETNHWNKDYINDGKEELKYYTTVNNTIANVSGVVFRRIDFPYKKHFQHAQQYQLAGDWYFYSKYMLYGKIAYNSESLNFHRMHSKGVTLSTDKFKQYTEIKKVQESIQEDVKISKIAKERIQKYDKITMDGFGICKKEVHYSSIPLSEIISNNKITDKTILSIIVSAYNAEKFIEKCLISIEKALPERTEILVIDDGSTDNTAQIIKQHIKKYPQIKYFYKENGGLSSVKNYGLSRASGKYIIFMDADDEIKPNGYKTMLKNAIDKNADIVICDMELVNETGGSINYPVCHKGLKGAKRFLADGLMASSNNKMIKKTLYEKTNGFPEGKNNEDVAVTPVLLAIATKIEYIHSSFYRYYQRKGSIQHTKFDTDRLIIFETVKQAITSIKKLSPSEAESISGIIICNQLIAILVYIIYPIKNKKTRYQIINEFNKRYRDLLNKENKYVNDYCAKMGLKNLQKYILHSSPQKTYFYIKRSFLIDYIKRAIGIK